MTHSKKIVVNTVAVYIKIILNTILTLISTRIVLQCLGASDFGLYNLIAGVITLMSFLNGALLVSTQRYLSIAIGENDSSKLKLLFNSSMLIHIILAATLTIVLISLQPLLINKILNIPYNLVHTAHIVYDIMVVTTSITLLQVPYSAAMNAHEDIHYWATTEAINCILRLASAVSLFYITSNKLEIYTLLVFISLIISFALKFIWCKSKYRETKLNIHDMQNKNVIKEMFSFVGWNTLGVSSMLVRNQGVAVLMNVFLGVVINAAYGIANQVSGLVMTLSSTIRLVFSPSIMQAHGAGDNNKMIRLAIFTSKMTFFISTLTALPLLIFMPEILSIWLKEPPIYSIAFCRLMIVAFIIEQYTVGLNRIIYAIGQLKWYQITMFVIRFAILPCGYISLKLGYSVLTIFILIILIEILCFITETFFSYKYTKFNLKIYLFNFVLAATITFITILVASENIISYYNYDKYNLLYILCSSLIICITYGLLYTVLIFSKEEKQLIFSRLKLYKKRSLQRHL